LSTHQKSIFLIDKLASKVVPFSSRAGHKKLSGYGRDLAVLILACKAYR